MDPMRAATEENNTVERDDYTLYIIKTCWAPRTFPANTSSIDGHPILAMVASARAPARWYTDPTIKVLKVLLELSYCRLSKQDRSHACNHTVAFAAIQKIDGKRDYDGNTTFRD